MAGVGPYIEVATYNRGRTILAVPSANLWDPLKILPVQEDDESSLPLAAQWSELLQYSTSGALRFYATQHGGAGQAI